MVYFDSDILIHYLVIQDDNKHATATRLYEEATRDAQFFVSLLSLQETSFVLSKLKVSNEEITRKIAVFITDSPVDYDLALFKRASALAEIMGYQNINDCIHTAIAELYCEELLTFNQSDFKRIQKHTNLKITLL